MRLRKKWFISCMAILFLLGTIGCGVLPAGCTACVCGTVEKLGEVVEESVTLFPNAEPTENPTTDSLANEMFLALDREMFVQYVTENVTILDQYCYDPAYFGIDRSSVPVSLGDFSEEAHQNWIEQCRKNLSRLQTIDATTLNEQNRFAYEVYVRYFEQELLFADLFYYEEPLDEYVGVHMNLPLVFGLYRFRDKQDVENYLTLLNDVPRYMEQVLSFEQTRAELGLFMTEDMLDQILSDLSAVADNRETSYLFATFRDALSEVDWLTDEERETYYERNDALLRTVWADAYQDLRDGLEELRPFCQAYVGMQQQGEASSRYFEAALKRESASDLDVEGAIDLLEESLDVQYSNLIYHSYLSDGEPKAFTSGTLEGDVRYLKTLMQRIVPDMPEVSVTYTDIPPELEESFSPAAYLIPALDHYAENVVLINPADETDLLTIAHEAYPGHMFQYVYQYAKEEIPLFQKVITPIGYAEGWSTNMELRVCEFADAYDPHVRQAEFYNEMAINTIVTVCSLMVNGQGATVADLEQYLSDWGMQDSAQYIYELSVDMPTYYFKYVLGFAQQYAIQQECLDRYSYDLPDFYEAYLNLGPCYFDQLAEKMYSWAEAQD